MKKQRKVIRVTVWEPQNRPSQENPPKAGREWLRQMTYRFTVEQFEEWRKSLLVFKVSVPGWYTQARTVTIADGIEGGGYTQRFVTVERTRE